MMSDAPPTNRAQTAAYCRNVIANDSLTGE